MSSYRGILLEAKIQGNLAYLYGSQYQVFHASTSIYSRRNNIDYLKLDRNLWTMDHPIIIQKIQSHFQNIFSSSNPVPLDGIEHMFPSKLTDQENDF